ncbi:heterokaryon incompatibility protein-domain-containing protein [Thelonectria olida]|uniref:Heterokaryon incompatibility protein-domain-containing protein n=1 Tax=Thelonectria olida TaxID=1576542 RepID=A0A9P9AH28_9HYPO|nr:heterokaryon incompatibility protein-domain-containing protein [Thelonectria olida]
MCKRFQRAQSEIPSPWKDIDITYVLDLLPEWSPLKDVYIICSRFCSRKCPPTPWHFRQTYSFIRTGILLFLATKFGGLGGPVITCWGLIVFDASSILVQQTRSVFSGRAFKTAPALDYQNKPRFAYAALSQTFAFALAVILLFKRSGLWYYILSIIPMSSVGTLLLYLASGHQLDYLNQPAPVENLVRMHEVKFCDICESTVSSSNRRDNIHHRTARSLQKAAHDGCRICAPVWERRSRVPQDFVAMFMYWKPATTFSHMSGGVHIRYSQDRYNVHECEFNLRNRKGWCQNGGHTGSDESLDLAVKWLRHFTVYHGLCCANQDERFRPSRLLYLENNSVCVHTAHDMPKRLRYLTLSHCWGKLHIIRLMEFNVDDFPQNIPFSYLPKTFQDAIRITRRLGFSYLWIDSLCIIQNSPTDWLHEARLMGKIYKNAACNIAASDAPDSRHGCLYPRDPRTLQPEPVRCGIGGKEQYLINATDIHEDKHILYTRAWVLQEALLARRTLDCARGQLFWRCGEMRATEVFPGGVPTNIYHDDHPASKFKAISAKDDQVILNANILEQRLATRKTRAMLPNRPGRGSVERYTNAPFAFWSTIVGDYTQMKLTKDTDRIVAIAGITDVFRPFFGEHWFGMWRIFMPVELLWRVVGCVKRPSTIRAPSWSWMSIEGPVSYTGCVFKYRRDELTTEFIDAEPAGEHGMRLRLSTPLLRIKSSPLVGSRSSICSIQGEAEHTSNGWIPRLGSRYGDILFDHCKDETPEEDLFCMCVQISKGMDRNEPVGLVLREVEDGVFERLGQFTSFEDPMIPILKQTSRREIILR